MRRVWDHEKQYDKVLFGQRHKFLDGQSIQILSGNNWCRFGDFVEATRNSKTRRKRRMMVGGKR